MLRDTQHTKKLKKFKKTIKYFPVGVDIDIRINKIKQLITVLAGGEWARHPVEPAETDIIKGLANILINLINRKQHLLFPKTESLTGSRFYN